MDYLLIERQLDSMMAAFYANLLLAFVIWGIFWGFYCCWIAKQQGKNAPRNEKMDGVILNMNSLWWLTAFSAGFFLGIFGAAAYIISGKTLQMQVAEAKALKKLMDEE
ncbi:MAG: hypothetical protein HAW64_06245 [Alphaproteobacteria bacterium]|nr:hypothetical protein [Alphaproteobacteria bacterium]